MDTFHFSFNLFHFPPIHYKVKDHMDITRVKQYKQYMQVTNIYTSWASGGYEQVLKGLSQLWRKDEKRRQKRAHHIKCKWQYDSEGVSKENSSIYRVRDIKVDFTCVQQKHDILLNSRATTPKKKVQRSTDNKKKTTGTRWHAWQRPSTQNQRGGGCMSYMQPQSGGKRDSGGMQWYLPEMAPSFMCWITARPIQHTKADEQKKIQANMVMLWVQAGLHSV